MTILSEIQKWAEKLPIWQQHAVAVLYSQSHKYFDDLINSSRVTSALFRQ